MDLSFLLLVGVHISIHVVVVEELGMNCMVFDHTHQHRSAAAV